MITIAWKIYFAIFMVLTISGAIIQLFQGELADPGTALLVAVLLIGLVGFYGFCFHKAILNKNIWRFVFALQVVLLIYIEYSQIFLGAGARIQFEALDYLFLLAVIILFDLPYLYGLFKYSFNSNVIWNKRA